MGFLFDRTNQLKDQIDREMMDRTHLAAHALRKAEMLVNRGRRGGRVYRVPGTRRTYHASAPGQPPAVRTGAYRKFFIPRAERKGGYTYRASIESSLTVNGYNLGNLLEHGTSKMAPRPHDERIIQKALPEIGRIYNRSFMR